MAVYRTIVTISGPSLGGIGTNTWHCRADDAGDAEEQLQLCTDQLSGFYNGIQTIVAEDTVFVHDGVFTIVSDETGTLVDTVGWTLNASSTTDPLPAATALVASWRTSSGGRRGRGRTFVSPLGVNTLQDNGTPTESARSTLSTEIADIADFNTANDGVAFVVWSALDSLGRDIVGGAVANKFASLRSRRD